MLDTKLFSKVKTSKGITNKPVKFDNAQKLADEINIEKNSSHFILLSGNFIYGDFIEALIIKNNWNVLELTISTLSADQNNISSLQTLLIKDYCQKLNLILSTYFFGFNKNQVYKFAKEELDIEKTTISICDTHQKIVLIRTECEKKIIIDGSANLPSSNNLEQIRVEENEELYNFNYKFQEEIIKMYNFVKKPLRGKSFFNELF